MTAEITPASLELFLSLAEDAPNWSGMPLVCITAEERGNLTQLKRAGLLTTLTAEGANGVGTDAFAVFTEAGVKLAAEHGFNVEVF